MEAMLGHQSFAQWAAEGLGPMPGRHASAAAAAAAAEAYLFGDGAFGDAAEAKRWIEHETRCGYWL